PVRGGRRIRHGHRDRRGPGASRPRRPTGRGGRRGRGRDRRRQRLPRGRPAGTSDGVRGRPRSPGRPAARSGPEYEGRRAGARLRRRQTGRPSLVVSCPTSMTVRLRLAALTIVLCALALAPGAAQPSLEGESLARAIQRHYDTVRDFTADFEQAYVGGALKRRTVEKGTVAIRKPGRMRWDYTTPEAKQFISDGQRIY